MQLLPTLLNRSPKSLVLSSLWGDGKHLSLVTITLYVIFQTLMCLLDRMDSLLVAGLHAAASCRILGSSQCTTPKHSASGSQERDGMSIISWKERNVNYLGVWGSFSMSSPLLVIQLRRSGVFCHIDEKNVNYIVLLSTFFY